MFTLSFTQFEELSMKLSFLFESIFKLNKTNHSNINSHNIRLVRLLLTEIARISSFSIEFEQNDLHSIQNQLRDERSLFKSSGNTPKSLQQNMNTSDGLSRNSRASKGKKTINRDSNLIKKLDGVRASNFSRI